ncbi:hypothetical protein JCM10908_000765 [Rhodotorula pacifica]|uniref:uncharacterized protein n=1 Tax=Rhodotorula pacifica TaxID=1495444 RepID=UPI003180E46F
MTATYERVQQVADEERGTSTRSKQDNSLNATCEGKEQQSRAAYKRAVVRAIVVTGTAALLALGLTTLYADEGLFQPARRFLNKDNERVLRAKRALEDTADKPKYSSLTTTDKQGAPTTQSFVYTTRPIVNPGGYTIGTLTGYVQLTATPSSATSLPSTASSSTAEPTSISTTEAAQSPTSTTPSRLPWLSRLSLENAAASSSEEAAASSSAPTAPPPAHLAKRALIEEVGAEANATTTATTTVVTDAPPATTPSASATDAGAEYSTSTDRAGSVYTLVKTTRPIVNPGGYTIGTLDGAWVDVAKQTQAPSTAANRKERAASPAAPVQQKQQHDELRKRNVVNLAGVEA